MAAKSDWLEVVLPHEVADPLVNPIALLRHVHDGDLHLLVSEEDNKLHAAIWHTKHPAKNRIPTGRFPTWDEIQDARDSVLPKESKFVAVVDRDKVIHLWEHE